MPEERCRASVQQPRLPRIGQLRQCADEICATSALDDIVVAREFPEQGEAGARQPYEWVKPQCAKGDLVNQTDEVVPPSRVGHLVDEDCVELPVIQQAIDPERQ